MPLPLIPLLLGGAALLTAGFGVKKGFDAKEDFDQAEQVTAKAQALYDKSQNQLSGARDRAQEQLIALGSTKRYLYERSLSRFVEVFSKIKNIDVKNEDISSELVIDQQEFAEIQEITIKMTDILESTAASLTGGALAGLGAFGGAGLLATASTGTAISALSGVAATNATLAWFGGGALAAGGLGMAGGMAVLGGIVAAPVLLVGGFMMAAKADAAVSDAYSNLAKAQAAAEVMKTACSAARAIQRRAQEIQLVLIELDQGLVEQTENMANLVNKKDDYSRYSSDERKLVGICMGFAKTVKSTMETPIFDDAGVVTTASKNMLVSAKDFLKKLSEM